jgi:hypothetical protein
MPWTMYVTRRLQPRTKLILYSNALTLHFHFRKGMSLTSKILVSH